MIFIKKSGFIKNEDKRLHEKLEKVLNERNKGYLDYR